MSGQRRDRERVPVNNSGCSLTESERWVLGWKICTGIFLRSEKPFSRHIRRLSCSCSFKRLRQRRSYQSCLISPQLTGLLSHMKSTHTHTHTYTHIHTHARTHTHMHVQFRPLQCLWSAGCRAHEAVSKPEPPSVADLRRILQPEEKTILFALIYEAEVEDCDTWALSLTKRTILIDFSGISKNKQTERNIQNSMSRYFRCVQSYISQQIKIVKMVENVNKLIFFMISSVSVYKCRPECPMVCSFHYLSQRFWIIPQNIFHFWQIKKKKIVKTTFIIHCILAKLHRMLQNVTIVISKWS